MAELPDDLRRQIAKNTDEVARVIDGLVSQMRLTPDEVSFAREQAGRVFDLLANAFMDNYPKVKRARCATAAAVIAFKSVQVWAEHDEAREPNV